MGDIEGGWELAKKWQGDNLGVSGGLDIVEEGKKQEKFRVKSENLGENENFQGKNRKFQENTKKILKS